jgi:ubiquinone/menaquinone biosynthesis C-methylase UbiE
VEGWRLSSLGALLGREGAGAGLRAWTELAGEEYLGAWGRLEHSVQTGEPAFARVFGQGPWQHRAERPALDAAFQRLAGGEQRRALSGLLRAYDPAPFRRVVDVGGGHGHLLAGLLQRHPEMSGVLFDLPHVMARAGEVLAQAGVAERCQVVAGSLLDGPPPCGDLLLLKHVLHNWEDDGCVRILSHCARAMASPSRLLVLESLMPSDGQPAEPALLMLDLHMLVMHGGRERTQEEYAALLESAGLQLLRRIATRAGAPDILEAALP